jgi:hypothetical protein
MWWTRAERRRGVEAVVVLAAEIMAPMTRTESTGPLLMASGSSSAPTGPQPRGRPRPDHRNSFHRHRLRAAWPCGRARGRDDGRILVTVVSTSRLPVVAEMSRARWPSSPSARSCGCLHVTGGATGKPSAKLARRRARSHVPLASASCVARGGWRASRRARSLGRRGSGRRACACAPAACAPVSLSRAQRQGRPKAARAACVAAFGAGGHTCGWRVGVPGLEEVGDQVDCGADRLARALVPRRVYCDGCVWVLCAWSKVCGGALVLISRAAGRRGRDLGGDRTSNWSGDCTSN